MTKKLICRCEEVTEEEVLAAIRAGARTVDGVKRRTRAGMGLCQGRSCRRLIAAILAEATGQDMGSLLPPTARPPVRTVKLGVIKGSDDSA